MVDDKLPSDSHPTPMLTEGNRHYFDSPYFAILMRTPQGFYDRIYSSAAIIEDLDQIRLIASSTEDTKSSI